MDLKSLMQTLDKIEKKQNLMEAGDPAEYARAQQQMANLEKAAKYTGDDPIVRSRMGLPPKLPPIEQWDGKMPQPTGKPDWIARLTSGGAATTDQAAAVATNKADDTSVAFKKEKLTKLKDLVAKISGTPAAESISYKTDIARSLVESFSYDIKESDIDEKVTLGTGPATTNSNTGVTAGKFQSEVAEIKKIMSELGDMSDDPEVAKALSDAQAALDKLSAPAAAKPADAAAAKPADAAATSSGEKGSKPVGPTATTQEKMDRFVYLMKKKKEGGAAPASSAAAPSTGALELPPGAAPEPGMSVAKSESMANLISKLMSLEESVMLEALTPEEEKELQTISKEVIGTVQSGAEGIPPEVLAAVKDFQAGSAPAGGQPASATAQAKPGAAGAPAGNQVMNIQKQLIALGVDVGKTGADGKMGPATIGGIKAFQKMAGVPEDGKITPEFEKLLAKGAQIKSQNNLVASITAIEQLLTKYKVESVISADDIDMMTEEEIRSYIVKNIRYLNENDQMSARKLLLTEAPLPVPAGAGGAMVPGGGAKPNPNVIDVPFRDVTPKPGVGSKIANFAKNVVSKVPGAGKVLAIGAAFGAGAAALWSGLKGAFKSNPNIQMDPADKAELDKHMAVIQKYMDDPEAAGGLPKDVQQRLNTVSQRLQKIAGKVAAAPAQPGAPAAAAPKPAAPAAPVQQGAVSRDF